MNNTYILLRNNIESKPVGLEDLKQIGLLPTDLLWVECQSVSWRHPQEITELKALLPETAIPENKIITDEWIEKYAPRVENTSQGNPDKNEVYIKRPSNGNSLKKKDETIEVKKDIDPATIKEAVNDHTAISTATINRLTINDILLDSDTSEKYFNKPVPPARKDLMETLLALPRKKIALYIGLVAAGALMMLIIRGKGGNDKIVMQPVHPQQEIVNTPSVEETAAPAEDTSTTPESYNQQNSQIAETTEASIPEQITTLPAKTATPVKKAVERKETAAPVTNEPTVAKPVVNEPPVEKSVQVENIASQLHIKANEYNVAAFGGIRNLVLTLKNDSRYLLDKVAVEVRYLNPEGTVVKTDNIDFNFVQPGEAAIVAVKKSSRGVKVSYKVLTIQSKELASKNSVPATANN
jgi:hypothetical protein